MEGNSSVDMNKATALTHRKVDNTQRVSQWNPKFSEDSRRNRVSRVGRRR